MGREEEEEEEKEEEEEEYFDDLQVVYGNPFIAHAPCHFRSRKNTCWIFRTACNRPT
jgi:hypothetical protein